MKTAREWIDSIVDNGFKQKLLDNIDLDKLYDDFESLVKVIDSFSWSKTEEWYRYWEQVVRRAKDWKIVLKDETKSFAVECPNDYNENITWKKYIKYLKVLWMNLNWTWPWSYYWVTMEWIAGWKTDNEKNKFWKIYDLYSPFITQLIWEKNIVKKIDEEKDTITIKRRRPYKLKLNTSF